MTLSLQTVQNQRSIMLLSDLLLTLFLPVKVTLLIVATAMLSMAATQWIVMKMELYQKLQHV